MEARFPKRMVRRLQRDDDNVAVAADDGILDAVAILFKVQVIRVTYKKSKNWPSFA